MKVKTRLEYRIVAIVSAFGEKTERVIAASECFADAVAIRTALKSGYVSPIIIRDGKGKAVPLGG